MKNFLLPLFVLMVLLNGAAVAQSPNGTINGLVLDPSSRAIVGADILVINDVTGVRFSDKTNDEGIYVVPNLPPGPYRVQVSKVGFKTIVKPDIALNVQDALALNFTLPVGALSETVTVEGGTPLVNTESATVSTVVDRQFAENLPLNGRSFQTLIQLTPGVVLTPSNANDSGQFSVNGQRANANYWMVDGVSANIGVSANGIAGNGLAGALPAFGAQGGTNGLVSVDALQEFRIQTSTYAPEFGRTPGAQISIVTRSGTNQFHGTVFDYLRNDILDANNWFNTFDIPALRKPAERQNDFGGTLGGPIRKDQTFFFFSYEGLRLRLPQVAQTFVPDAAARQNALPALQPYLNAYPAPSGLDNLATGIAQFNSSFSNSSSLDASSVRVDHKLNGNLTLFGRYNYSPSNLRGRGGFAVDALSSLASTAITTETATIGATATITTRTSNDLRFNYSKTDASTHALMDDFGGAVPLTVLPFPGELTGQNSQFAFVIRALGTTHGAALDIGKLQRLVQRQVNVVDSLTMQRGAHGIKVGADFRRLSPLFAPQQYGQQVQFADVQSAEAGNSLASIVRSARGGTLLFHNLGIFAQDTWRLLPRLTLTYGLRWDVDFAPSTESGPSLLSVTGFNLLDLSHLGLAPAGTPPFNTTYDNIAPRVGVAYQLQPGTTRQSVLRGGFGVFYDLATQEFGNNISATSYPFGATQTVFGGSFPLFASAAAPPPINVATLSEPGASVAAFDPHLKLPYTLQWNIAFEQALGLNQSISASYIGSVGRRLIQTGVVEAPSPSFANASVVSNTAVSNYNALQLQLQRRVSRGFQVLASYTWSHSIDTASAGSGFFFNNAGVPGIDSNANRGASDFDVRNAFSVGLTYDVPALKIPFGTAILRGWSVQTVIQARSAPPVDLYDGLFFDLNGAFAVVRPDLVPGQPLYLNGVQCTSELQGLGELLPSQECPGGKALNPHAFTDPPFDPATFQPLREGTVPRNFLRGFGATQWDLAIHRSFPIWDALHLEFRAELFNVLNHPNFGPPSGAFIAPQFGGPAGFGLASQMLNQSLNFQSSNLGGGAFNPLYQIGGPRSIQLAIKFNF